MIDLREINETIDNIKRKGGTVNDAVTLAMLYIAREHMQREDEIPDQMAQNYARAAEPIPVKEMPVRVQTRGTSPFLEACEGLPMEKVLLIIDEHMEAIRVLYPKEYDAILRRLDKMRE